MASYVPMAPMIKAMKPRSHNLQRDPVRPALPDLALTGSLLRVAEDGDLYIINRLCTSPPRADVPGCALRELGAG
jgi:hypothetical protein